MSESPAWLSTRGAGKNGHQTARTTAMVASPLSQPATFCRATTSEASLQRDRRAEAVGALVDAQRSGAFRRVGDDERAVVVADELHPGDGRQHARQVPAEAHARLV